MEHDDERKFGKCPICQEDNKWLYFAIGTHKGNLWCNFICNDCYKMILDMNREKEVTE